MELRIETRADDIAIVHLAGRLDLVTAAGVKQQITAAVADGRRRLVVELAEVTFIDSSGLGVLIGSMKAARLAGGDMRIAGPTEQARTILQLTTLDRIIQPYSSVEEALEHFEQTTAH